MRIPVSAQWFTLPPHPARRLALGALFLSLAASPGTRSTLAQMVRDPGVADVIRNIMQEVEAVSRKLGMKLPVSIEQRMAGAEKVGEHKTSMLQDLEAGRPMELEALVGSMVELGEKVGVPMAYTRTVYSCARLLAQRSVSTRQASK